jgi:DNA-binding MarR family transcriptional regulator
MSNQKRQPLIEAIDDLMREYYETSQELNDAAANVLRVNRTDLLLLSILAAKGSLTMGALTEASGLSKPAMTTAIDRLTEAGYVDRKAHSSDRRSLNVVRTELAKRRSKKIYSPLKKYDIDLLGTYSISELEVLENFLGKFNAMLHTHVTRVRLLTEDFVSESS